MSAFHAFYGLFLYPLKTLENQRFSDVFRGCRKRPVAWNELISQCKSATKLVRMIKFFVHFKFQGHIQGAFIPEMFLQKPHLRYLTGFWIHLWFYLLSIFSYVAFIILNLDLIIPDMELLFLYMELIWEWADKMKAMVSGLLPSRKIACRLGLGANFFWRKFFLEPKATIHCNKCHCILLSKVFCKCLFEMVAYF